jgi:hypothetical protein
MASSAHVKKHCRGCACKTRFAFCLDCRQVLTDMSLRAALYEVGRVVRQMKRREVSA